MRQKAVVILGPTSSGKSDLAVRLAKKFNGEIISADSRQVYKGLNIGAGKITRKEMCGVPHYLLDVAHPKKIFTADAFQKKAQVALSDILNRKKLPIICGGTGFYIKALVDNIKLPDVPPDMKLRAKLEKKTTVTLAKMLQKLDPKRSAEVDPCNRPRLIRAIEISKSLGNVPPIAKHDKDQNIDFLQIGIATDEKELQKKVATRLTARLKKGMVAEVRKLHASGLSWKRLEMLGLEYRNVSLFLQNKISKEKMIETLKIETAQYAKRQMRWFRRDQRIVWLPLSKEKVIRKAVSDFLTN